MAYRLFDFRKCIGKVIVPNAYLIIEGQTTPYQDSDWVCWISIDERGCGEWRGEFMKNKGISIYENGSPKVVRVHERYKVIWEGGKEPPPDHPAWSGG